MSLLSTFWSWTGALFLPLLATATDGGGDEPPASDGRALPDRSGKRTADLIRAVLDGDDRVPGLVERYEGGSTPSAPGWSATAGEGPRTGVSSRRSGTVTLPVLGQFYTWLCIAMNVSIDHLRRQKVRRAESFDEAIASRDSAGVIILSTTGTTRAATSGEATARRSSRPWTGSRTSRSRSSCFVRSKDGVQGDAGSWTFGGNGHEPPV